MTQVKFKIILNILNSVPEGRNLSRKQLLKILTCIKKQQIEIISDNMEDEIKKYLFPKNCIDRSDIKLTSIQIQAIKFMDNNDNLLVVFDTGVGKTLTALTSSQCYLDKNPNNKVIVISPVSVLKNFHKEMKKYGGVIDERYEFYSYSKFLNLHKKKQQPSCRNSMLIIDEAHNLRTTGYNKKKGVFNKHKGKTFQSIYKCASKADKVLLLTATPVVNDARDLFALAELLKIPNSRKCLVKKKPETKELLNCIDIFKGKLIYFRIKKSKDYPNVETHIKKIYMSTLDYKKYAYDIYNSYLSDPAVFFHGFRQSVNVVGNNYYSVKMNGIINLIKGQCVIFTNWLEKGTDVISRKLEEEKISYGIIQGSVSINDRNKIVNKYNKEKIQVLIITRAGSEGIDLKGTNNLFILDPMWHPTGLHQIVGRAVRYKSHEHLPPEKRVVNIYYVILSPPKDIEKPIPSGDEILYTIIKLKEIQQKIIYDRMKEISI